jgi:hypothetical protein
MPIPQPKSPCMFDHSPDRDKGGSYGRAEVLVYALGLVLDEIFTGQRAFLTADRQVTPTAASGVKDIDPVIERAITRCLEPDAAKRPPVAH